MLDCYGHPCPSVFVLGISISMTSVCSTVIVAESIGQQAASDVGDRAAATT